MSSIQLHGIKKTSIEQRKKNKTKIMPKKVIHLVDGYRHRARKYLFIHVSHSKNDREKKLDVDYQTFDTTMWKRNFECHYFEFTPLIYA